MSEETPNLDEDKVKTISVKPVGNKPEALWNTAFFFPCLFHDSAEGSLAKLLNYLQSSERSLKMCVMVLSYEPVINTIIERHRAGVHVQVFTSHNSAHDPKTGKAGKMFRAEGICIRSIKAGDYCTEMHNKYAIVDDEAVLTGSLNWNVLSITHQHENIMVTTDKRIVPQFVQNFDELWSTNIWHEEMESTDSD